MPAKSKKTRRRPVKRARLGGTTLSVQRLADGRFALVTHRPDGSRSKKEYATQAEAVTAFERKSAETARLGLDVAGAVADSDARAVADFRAAVAGWENPPSVAEVLSEYLKARQALGQSGTVAEAVARRNADALRRNLSARHRLDIENRLEKFEESFGTRALASIKAEELEKWITGLGLSAVSQFNFRKVVSSVFADAVRTGRLDKNPMAAVRVAKGNEEEIGIISAEEMGRLLRATPARSLPALAIMALGGLRRAEAERLTWESVKLAERIITISAGTAKTSSRRHVPVSDALAAWLAAPSKDAEGNDSKGKIAPTAQQFRKDTEAARRAAKIETWPNNCLRHGCASAWVAVEPNAALVASWLGNSPQMVFKHYRALISRAEAEAWHSTFPPGHKPAQAAPKGEGQGTPAKARKRPAKGASATALSADTPSEPETASAKIIQFKAAAS